MKERDIFPADAGTVRAQAIEHLRALQTLGIGELWVRRGDKGRDARAQDHPGTLLSASAAESLRSAPAAAPEGLPHPGSSRARATGSISSPAAASKAGSAARSVARDAAGPGAGPPTPAGAIEPADGRSVPAHEAASIRRPATDGSQEQGEPSTAGRPEPVQSQRPKGARSAGTTPPPAGLVAPEREIVRSASAPGRFDLGDEEASAGALPAADRLERLRTEEIGDCTRCKLSGGRKTIVFGSGNAEADLMFVGEAPGADEDEQGLPFVGRAGQLLTKMIESMVVGGNRLRREQVFIANIIKCRPPGNRDPEAEEIAACEGFLFTQIAIIKPRVIVTLGAFAARTLLRSTAPISALRGRFHEYRGTLLMPTFHPAYVLRNYTEQTRRTVYEDLKKAAGELERPGAGT